MSGLGLQAGLGLLLPALPGSEQLLQLGHGPLSHRVRGQPDARIQQLAQRVERHLRRILEGGLDLLKPACLVQLVLELGHLHQVHVKSHSSLQQLLQLPRLPHLLPKQLLGARLEVQHPVHQVLDEDRLADDAGQLAQLLVEDLQLVQSEA
uniref:Putative secreted protein n=1 Tax=Ixodes ricinus TaxID=34613 RepID=A0A6B0UV47_IXORI